MYYYFYKVGIKGNSDSEKMKLEKKNKQYTEKIIEKKNKKPIKG